MLDEKDLERIDQIFAHRLNVMLESAIKPQFDLLAENQQIMLETLAAKERVEELEDELDVLRGAIRQHSADIASLKKAVHM